LCFCGLLEWRFLCPCEGFEQSMSSRRWRVLIMYRVDWRIWGYFACGEGPINCLCQWFYLHCDVHFSLSSPHAMLQKADSETSEDSIWSGCVATTLASCSRYGIEGRFPKPVALKTSFHKQLRSIGRAPMRCRLLFRSSTHFRLLERAFWDSFFVFFWAYLQRLSAIKTENVGLWAGRSIDRLVCFSAEVPLLEKLFLGGVGICWIWSLLEGCFCPSESCEGM
jgi:hypothetical protein